MHFRFFLALWHDFSFRRQFWEWPCFAKLICFCSHVGRGRPRFAASAVVYVRIVPSSGDAACTSWGPAKPARVLRVHSVLPSRSSVADGGTVGWVSAGKGQWHPMRRASLMIWSWSVLWLLWGWKFASPLRNLVIFHKIMYLALGEKERRAQAAPTVVWEQQRALNLPGGCPGGELCVRSQQLCSCFPLSASSSRLCSCTRRYPAL